MKKRKFSTSVMVVMMTVLLSLAGGLALAAKDKPLKPELAAKREMVRQQEEQRVTPEKRKTATAALKAERRKVYRAKKAVEKLNQAGSDNK